MNIIKAITLPKYALRNTSKEDLVSAVILLREKINSNQKTYELELSSIQAKLKEKEAELIKLKHQEIDATANQPSSKQPEYNKDTGSKKKKKKKKKRKGRKGAGNRPKPAPDVFVVNTLQCCPDCHADLTAQPVIDTVVRIIEDIPPPPKKTIVTQETQERKWCPECGKIVASVSEAALPKSDIGLQALVLVAYLWVVSAISLPGISRYLNAFFHLLVSTSGLSKMMIRLAGIMEPVYDEILSDVKNGMIIFADETGWRVKGVLWWLWIFANKRSAYYWPDRHRGSAVVEKILGTLFTGVLVTDAWCAYMKIVCTKQTCMAHIMRKIRKFRDAYPEDYSIILFYKKLRRILLDGEKLQLTRKDIGEEVFLRRLKFLKQRLKKLLNWKNSSDALAIVIKKVARQEAYILTFVEHGGVPNHNNYGEYIIKKGILKRKVSGGSMSEDGVRAYAVLQSIAQTCHLRNISFGDFLTASLISYIRTGKILSLNTYEAKSIELNIERKAA